MVVMSRSVLRYSLTGITTGVKTDATAPRAGSAPSAAGHQRGAVARDSGGGMTAASSAPRGRLRGIERSEIRRARLGGGPLDGAIAGDDVVTEIGERGAAAPRTARLGGDDRRAKRAIERVDQRPRAAVRHAHRAPGR